MANVFVKHGDIEILETFDRSEIMEKIAEELDNLSSHDLVNAVTGIFNVSGLEELEYNGHRDQFEIVTHISADTIEAEIDGDDVIVVFNK